VEASTTTAAIVAGGRARRFAGQDKSRLVVEGRTIIVRQVDVLQRVASRVFVVGHTSESFADLNLPTYPDRIPGAGALGGIYTALTVDGPDAVLVVACDMPFVSPAVARLVTSRAPEADVVAPRVGEQWETLHACYGKACLGPMERRLRAGRLKITGFFDEVRVLAIPEAEIARLADPARVFMNVNTPEELARARALAAAG